MTVTRGVGVVSGGTTAVGIKILGLRKWCAIALSVCNKALSLANVPSFRIGWIVCGWAYLASRLLTAPNVLKDYCRHRSRLKMRSAGISIH